MKRARAAKRLRLSKRLRHAARRRWEGFRAFWSSPEGRRRLVTLAVGAVLLAVLLAALRGDPARVAPIVARKLIQSSAPEIAKVLRQNGALDELRGEGLVCSLDEPELIEGPCGDTLARALAELCDWRGPTTRPTSPPRVVCRGEAERVTLSLSFRPLPGAPPVTRSWRRALPSSTSLLPPLIAILLAIAFRQVLVALGAAVWLGATIAVGGDPVSGLGAALASYALPAVVDNGLIFTFTLSLMGMVSVMVRGAGVQGLVDLFSRHAKSPRSAQLVTAAMGTVIFFDDYANSVIVGASARPLTDAKRISREKLAYLVDSTAAPVAGMALISTWIGIELGFLGEQLGYVPGVHSAYELFFLIIPYRFYCLFTLAFVFMLVLVGRDFGPMLRAERRARRSGKLLRDGAVPLAGAALTHALPKRGAPRRALNAILPIAVTLGTAFGGLLVAGYAPMTAAGIPFDLLTFETWRAGFVYGGDASSEVLAIAGVAGSLSAILLLRAQHILTLRQGVATWLRGVWAMRLALGILVLAIAIRGVTEDLDTAPLLVSLLHDVPAVWLPILSFLTAAAVSFSTGTSWGTMGILLPVVVPLVAHQLATGPAAAGPVLLLAIASVLDGAIFGDHCSPISDTTVLSSLASASDHMDHVRTQAPYAILTMSVAGLVGYILVAWTGLSWFIVFPSGLALLLLTLLTLGRRPEAPS